MPALGTSGDHATEAGAARHAVASRALTISPAPPRVGQLYRVAGRTTAGAARPVRLEVLDQGGSWRAKGRAVTARNGAFRFSWSSDRTQRLRVVAPRVARTHGRAAQSRWISRAVRVAPRSAAPTATPTPTPTPTSTPTPTQAPKPVVQTVALAAPPFALEQQHATLTASVAPAVAARGVVLQRRDGSAWTTVASASTGASGAASFEVETAGAGSVTYRAVAEAATDVLEGVSEPVPLEVRAGLPRVDITTDDGLSIGATQDADGDPVDRDTDGLDDDKFTYTHGSVSLDPRGSGVPAFAQTSRFRVRGNSTAWTLVKLSFKIKLDQKARLLPSSSSKNWALLANFYDRSLLRNQVAFEASRRLEMAWTPTTVSVELWQNGSYAGVYQLAETAESGSDRLDIDTDGDDSAGSKAANGGYLLEADHWADTDPHFTTGKGAQVFLKEPEFESVDSAPYVAGVKSYLDEFETALYSSGFADPTTGYRKYVDVDTFVNWYLLNELMKNLDSGYDASCWMYRDKDGKLSMGPAWDFDQSSGSRHGSGLGDPTGWFLRKKPQAAPVSGSMFSGADGHWLNRMFQDPWFVGRVQQRWGQVRTDLQSLPDYLETEAAALAPAATRNFTDLTGPPGHQIQLPVGWTFLEEDGIFFGSWSRTVQHVDYWLSDRLAWMDGQLYTGS